MNPTIPRRDLFEQAVRILEQMGFPAKFRELYSGPFMYGNAMAAIDPPAPSATVGAAVALATREANPDAKPEAIAKVLPTGIDAVKTSGMHYKTQERLHRARGAAGCASASNAGRTHL